VGSLRIRRRPDLAVAVLMGAALVAWIVTIRRMRGMDMGPGTDLGSFGWFVGIWTTMTAAMMLPSISPVTRLFAQLAGLWQTALFVLGYLAVWIGFGLVAYAVARELREHHPAFLAWEARGPIVAGAALVGVAVYQVTPLKQACLRRCRSPLALLTSRKPGGATRLGAEHAVVCVGCCAGLMLIMFVLGVMSLLWMAVVAALVFAEKVAPHGERLTSLLAIVFVLAGVWLAAAPASFPGLTQP
jgi:predicted metal-binding membrane protein